VSAASHDALLALLSRRQVLARASTIAVGLVALPPVALPLPLPISPPGTGVSPSDATLQAFADTMLPGCRADRTDLGNPIDPLAIAGVDPRPGAVQADALALSHHPEVGFDPLAPGFLSDLETRSLPHGGDFLHLDFAARLQVCMDGLGFSNPSRTLWELAAAIAFIAFCAAPLIRDATANQACGYRVMGLPGVAPNGYREYSYGRQLSVGRTRAGSLP
jgi:enediyne biosynthesis protein E8